VPSAREAIIQYNPDLVFLDIHLQHDSAFDLLETLPEIKFEIIFVTAYSNYGLQAIKFAALDYILKPIDELELSKALEKAKTRIEQKSTNERLQQLLENLNIVEQNALRIALPTFEETRFVHLTEVVRCEADAGYTRFILNSGECILVSRTLKEYVDMLQGYGFLRPHQSHLVNKAFIKSWVREDGGLLLMNDSARIPISKSNRKSIKDILSKIHKT